MNHNTQHHHKRTINTIKGLLATLLIASVAIASPAAAESSSSNQLSVSATITLSSSDSSGPNGTYQMQVAWGGCGGNCGK